MFRLFYILLFIFFFSGISAQDNALRIAASEESDSLYNPKNPPQKASLNNIVLVHKENNLVKAQVSAVDNEVDSELDHLMEESDTLDKERILRQWKLSRDFIDEEPIAFDTLFSLFNRYRIIDSYSPVNAQLGNYGLPYYPVNFFDRISDPDKFLYSGLYHFMHTSESAVFMNVQVPFTELKWTIGGQKEKSEQTFRLKHTQNVNSKFNFGVIFDVIYSLGQYTMQRSEDKTFTFFTSYTGNKYNLYFSAGVNNLFGQENGGIKNKNDLDINIQDTRNIEVNLGTYNNAASALKNRNFLVVQRFTFLGLQPDKGVLPLVNAKSGAVSGTFSHIFQIDNTRRSYSETRSSGFYDTIYINNQSTLDSLSAKSMKNTFRFDFTADIAKSLKYVAGFGLRNERFRFGQIIPAVMDTIIVADTASWFKGDNVLLGRFSNYVGKNFSWTADGELFLDGYRQGDYMLNGLMTKSFDLNKGKLDLVFTGKIAARTPAFWYNQWGGNNFVWNNDFGKETRTEFGAKIVYPARNFNLRFNFAIIDNYLDFDAQALPSQYDSKLTVASAAVGKSFRLWKFHIIPDVNIQKSSSTKILDLPLASIRTAAYFDHMFYFASTGGELYTQLGVDVIYHTPYHAYSYMPATGRFYRQSTDETGNYPFINAFINLKVKRTRFFFMFDHVNYGLMNSSIRYDYEMIPYNPWNDRRFTFGLAWTFYN